MASTATKNQVDLFAWAWIGVAAYLVWVIAKTAYRIRMLAIEEFGPVIHEFDPYFNYRATEYLYYNGMERFFKWFDYMVWYPLGRPVGTTIFPGMQFTAVWIKRYLLPNWSLNDVCCYIPTWFGAIASAFVGLIAYECSIPANTQSNIIGFVWDIIKGKKTPVQVTSEPLVLGFWSPAVECGLFSMAMMAIVPAHLMRSIGGGYDNESIAMSAMVMTFYCWVRSLRCADPHSHWWGILTGLAYFYMVAVWGGYVFVLNMIGLHAAMLVGMGRFSTKTWASYSLFYIIGTALATRIPVVGLAPLRSLEQIAPALVFIGYQLLQFCEIVRSRKSLDRKQAWKLRIQVFTAAAIVGFLLIFMLTPRGYFGPISSRVRGLFVQHTKTGNPLVDSVAEHQAANSKAYFQYLHHVCSLAPLGYLIVFFKLSDASSFLLCWGAATYFFSHKMVRLILLTAPIASILGGIAAGRVFVWCAKQWWESAEDQIASGASENTEVTSIPGKRKKGTKKGAAQTDESSFNEFVSLQKAVTDALKTKEGVLLKRTAAIVLLVLGYILGSSFVNYCWKLSADMSHPTIIVKGRTREGAVVVVDDYRDAYLWLRDNTPTDARIMAWWDYGYQITGIANRTTIADGNTWNHEHIALLGKALTTNVEEGWEIARHLADYVLIWGGGGGDDLAKSPHLARIANSVYREHCPDDPTCRAFGFIDRQGTPSSMMARSLLFHLHGHKLRPGVEVPEDRFQEVYRSKYGRVRIYKVIGISEESKEWVANPANRLCDTPGSWFCRGQYPPGLSKVLSSKKDFRQLEDFNQKSSFDDEYQKRYFQDLADPESARRKALENEAQQEKQRQAEQGIQKKVDEIYNTWEDTEYTTRMWRLISSNSIEDLKAWLDLEPYMAYIRSKDGRGPMWWAFEQRNEEITKLLMKMGVPHTDKDANGISPVQLLEGGGS